MKLFLIVLFGLSTLSLVCGSFSNKYGRLTQRFGRNAPQPQNQQQQPHQSPMRMMRYVYRGSSPSHSSAQQEIQKILDSLPELTAPSGGYVQRIYRVRQMPQFQPMTSYEPVVIEEAPVVEVEPEPEPEPEPAPVVVQEEQQSHSEPIMNLFKKLMKQSSNRLQVAPYKPATTCGWDNVGTNAANALVEAAMEARGGFYNLVALRKRMESMSSRCEVTNGQNSCTSEHTATVEFTISESDQCAYKAKCKCRLANAADVVECRATGSVSEDFQISDLEYSCDDEEVSGDQ